MISYVTVGTNDLAVAGNFFDEIIGELGGSRMMEGESMVAWRSSEGAGFGIITPFDKEKASVGNGVMVSLTCSSKEQVDNLYKKVLELGGTDEGEPGFRNPGMYMAYWRDLDGNKFNFFHMGETES